MGVAAVRTCQHCGRLYRTRCGCRRDRWRSLLGALPMSVLEARRAWGFACVRAAIRRGGARIDGWILR